MSAYWDKRSQEDLASAILESASGFRVPPGKEPPLSLAMRSEIGGWVEKRFIRPDPDKGLTVNRCAVAADAAIGFAEE